MRVSRLHTSNFHWVSSIIVMVSMLVCTAAMSTEKSERPKLELPKTDIYLFDLDLRNTDSVISNGTNITQQQDYDNQPFFTSDSASFIFSSSDGYQIDVYEYFLETKQTRRLTNTSATEFSPTPSPDNQTIAFVSDRNGGIWAGKRGSINNPNWVLESSNNREPVGYFAWNHATHDLVYWSRYGFSLALVNQLTGSYHFVAGNTPPSTPHIIPDTNNFSFVHRQMNGQVWIKELNPTTKAIRPLIALNGDNTNYTWSPDNSILMIQDGQLYRWKMGTEDNWKAVADLTKLGLKNANRLAVSPDGSKLAIVAAAE